jgi:hypothetical protein
MAEMNTAEIQAVIAKKYPYSHHLFPRVEQECETIATRYEGYGEVCLPFQGLFKGKLIIKHFITKLTGRFT